MDKKVICLYGLIQLALIIKCDSGVVYNNQTGGNFCLQNQEEGILAIIFDSTGDILNRISLYTQNKIALTEEDADYINEILWSYSVTRMLSVDKSKLNDSVEAWIYVDIEDKEEIENKLKESNHEVHPVYDFRGFGKKEGVLTWDNSD
jgi:hypothetical protein